jgi:hypothetical protein
MASNTEERPARASLFFSAGMIELPLVARALPVGEIFATASQRSGYPWRIMF